MRLAARRHNSRRTGKRICRNACRLQPRFCQMRRSSTNQLALREMSSAYLSGSVAGRRFRLPALKEFINSRLNLSTGLTPILSLGQELVVPCVSMSNVGPDMRRMPA